MIQHILGVCPDTHSHIDLLNLFTNFTPVNEILHFIYTSGKHILLRLITTIKG